MTEAHKPGRQAHAPRHLARVFALLGFYQWIADPTLKAQKIEENLPALLADDEEGTPVEDLGLTSEDWARCDRELLTTLLSGAIGEHAALEAEFSPFVDRDLKRVSLVERAILFIGTYELLRCPQTPYRVVLNETIELAISAAATGSLMLFSNAWPLRCAQLSLQRITPRRKPNQQQFCCSCWIEPLVRKLWAALFAGL